MLMQPRCHNAAMNVNGLESARCGLCADSESVFRIGCSEVGSHRRLELPGRLKMFSLHIGPIWRAVCKIPVRER